MLPFLPQETRYSCVPACLKMIMADMGIVVDEATLREGCKSDRLGTTAKNAVACAQSYGLQAFAATDVTNEKLLDLLADDDYPIVYLNLFPIETLWVTHAVVVESIADDIVTYMDPITGRRDTMMVTFEQAWQMSKRQAIVIVFQGVSADEVLADEVT